MTRGGKGGHEQRPLDLGAAATGSSLTLARSALVGMWAKPADGGPTASEPAEFGHQGDQRGGGLAADPGDLAPTVESLG